MTLKQAKLILEKDDVSIDELLEAQKVIEKSKKKPSNPENTRKAYQKWRQRNSDINDLKNEIRKYWRK